MLKVRPFAIAAPLIAICCIMQSADAGQLFMTSAFKQTSGSTNEIFRYQVNGASDSAEFELTITHDSLDLPWGLAFANDGELFVTNRGLPSAGNGSISRFRNATGTPEFNGVITGGMSVPHGMAFRGNELFVAQRFGGNVLRFVADSSGHFTPNGEITEGFGNTTPRATLVTPAGDLLVTEARISGQGNRLSRFTFDSVGNAALAFATSEGLDNPHTMVIAPWGELLVANANSDSISRYVLDADGNPLLTGQIIGNGMDEPIGMTFTPWGELFVANHAANRVSRFTFDPSRNSVANGTFATPNTLGQIVFAPDAVPEPASIVLALIGAAGISFARVRCGSRRE